MGQGFLLRCCVSKIVAFLLTWFLFSRHGSPRVLLSDDGLNFTSQAVTELTTLFDTCSTFLVLYIPVNNGAVEKANGTLVSILFKMASFNPLHWPR